MSNDQKGCGVLFTLINKDKTQVFDAEGARLKSKALN